MAKRSTYAKLALAAIAITLAVLSFLDPNGHRKHLRLTAEIRRIESENVALRQSNARLRREVRALGGEPAALEQAAREDLGYVRPDEIVINFGDSDVPR